MTTKKENMNNVMSETRVICPVCKSEFSIPRHEHRVSNATVIGADSGLGDVYLHVKNRGDALRRSGIDTSRYFSIELPTGGSQMMRMDDNGKAVPVDDDDPVVAEIINGGTVPNRRLFRRWVMSQVFSGLMYDDGRGNKGFTEWMKRHGYEYTWKMLIEEIHVQSKLFAKDRENYEARNRWFNKQLAYRMANDYMYQLEGIIRDMPRKGCKGVPYVTIENKDYFVTDLYRKLYRPLDDIIIQINNSLSLSELETALRKFYKIAPMKGLSLKQCEGWKDAYKGMGAYATMDNLLRFHGCFFPKCNTFYVKGMSDLKMLENAAKSYAGGKGWRLFGLMKQMIAENGIDINAKREEWHLAKKAKRMNRA